jgi:hypothetical protein
MNKQFKFFSKKYNLEIYYKKIKERNKIHLNRKINLIIIFIVILIIKTISSKYRKN